MKNIIVLLCLSLLFSCAKKDSTVAVPIPAETVTDTLAGKLFEQPDAKFIDVNLTSEKVIEGSTNYHVFSTSDKFTTLTLSSYTPFADISAFVTSGPTLLRVEHNGTEVRVLYSTNYGKDINIFKAAFEQGLPPADVRAYAFLDDQHIILSAGQALPSQNGFSYQTLIYRINIATGMGELLSTVDDYYAYSMHVNNNRIWMTWSSDQNEFNYFTTGYVAYSDDGGMTWSSPVFIDYGYYLSVAASPNNELFAWSPDAAYYSTDTANTWHRSDVNAINFTSAQFVDQQTIYALGHELMKSVDGGASWNIVEKYVASDKVWGTPKFINASEGIVFNDNQIFYTEDGGATWQLIMSKSFAH